MTSLVSLTSLANQRKAEWTMNPLTNLHMEKEQGVW